VEDSVRHLIAARAFDTIQNKQKTVSKNHTSEPRRESPSTVALKENVGSQPEECKCEQRSVQSHVGSDEVLSVSSVKDEVMSVSSVEELETRMSEPCEASEAVSCSPSPESPAMDVECLHMAVYEMVLAELSDMGVPAFMAGKTTGMLLGVGNESLQELVEGSNARGILRAWVGEALAVLASQAEEGVDPEQLSLSIEEFTWACGMRKTLFHTTCRSKSSRNDGPPVNPEVIDAVGQQLYPLVESLLAELGVPMLAGKVTGMLLELDTNSLFQKMILIMAKPEDGVLRAWVGEALAVLVESSFSAEAKIAAFEPWMQ